MNKRALLPIITAISCEAFSIASIKDFITPADDNLWQKVRTVNMHPYRKHSPLPQHALHIHGLVDLETYGKLLLSYGDIPNQFEIIANKKKPSSVRYRFRLNGVRICDLEVALHSLPANRIYYVGKFPTGSPHMLRIKWPSMFDVQDIIAAAMPEAKIISRSRCLLNTSAGLLPVYDVKVIDKRLPYKLRITADSIIDKHKLFADAQGVFEVYQENRVRSKKRTRVTVEVSGSGSLDNDYFTTVSIDNSIARAYSEDNEFIYPEGDERMPEVNSFVHANKMLDWFIGMGFKPSKSDKVVIEVNPSIYDLEQIDVINNAYYIPKQPSATDSYARIFLGRGDGFILQNIPNDSDVVAHELGHHVIFSYLENFQHDRGVLHEALADYFVYAKTNNSCLAESICPKDSAACYLKGKCLRSAATDLTYRAVQASKSQHEKGMVLSSALWNLRSHPDSSRTKVDQIVYGSMDFFFNDTDQRGFIESMLASEYKLFGGKYCERILHAMHRKGYGWHIEGLSCDEVGDYYDIRLKSHSEGELRRDRDDSYDYRAPACSTLLLSSNNSNYVLMLLALSPLIIGWQLRRYRINRM